MATESIKIQEEDVLVRVYISEHDKCLGRPLYEAIVEKAREMKIAGATVLRGIMGYGADRRMHTAKLVELSDNLPVVIEIVDIEENINRLLPVLDDLVKDGFVTIEKVHVLKYRLK